MKFEFDGRNVFLRGMLPKDLLNIEAYKSLLSSLDKERGLFLQLREANVNDTQPKVPKQN